ncbi:MAG: TM2 domain-containing protein [Actinomycetales bacterium]|nr:TM2 domain-containing protein [Actinomycetales bacterium]
MSEPTPEETPDVAPAAPGATPPPVGGYAPPPPPGAQWAGAAAPQPGAPFGVDPLTGLPFSDKTKLIAGLLQILIPIGIGRMYMGQIGLGVAQLLVTVVTCGIGSIWSFIDGILILVGQPKDEKGLPLR